MAAETVSKYRHSLKDLPLIAPNASIRAKMIASEELLMSFIECPPETDLAMHSHEAMQVLIVLEGSLDHNVGDESFHLEAGDVVLHPSNIVHGGYSKTGFKGLDIFVPPREDYLDLMRRHGLPTPTLK